MGRRRIPAIISIISGEQVMINGCQDLPNCRQIADLSNGPAVEHAIDDPNRDGIRHVVNSGAVMLLAIIPLQDVQESK